jgi:mRNA-degrading endonuclease RelE of RelBE toxin-antitoxin system
LIVYEFRFQEFVSDLDKLGGIRRKRVIKTYQKIKQTPTRFKHLPGNVNCYSVKIGGLRIIYALEGETSFFLTVGQRGKIY